MKRQLVSGVTEVLAIVVGLVEVALGHWAIATFFISLAVLGVAQEIRREVKR